MLPEGRRPILCLITDRRRLAAAVGKREDDWQTLLLNQIDGAARGGVDVIQIRERDLDARVLAAFVRRCVAAIVGTPVRLVVNDRVDIVMAAGADGVHLREDGIPTLAARNLMGNAGLVGRSVHRCEDAGRAGPVDYLIAGSVFESVSKPGGLRQLGVDGLQAIVDRAAPCPVWAIGGITTDRLPAVSRAGARGIAAIGAFIPSCEASVLATSVQKRTAELRFCFDSLRDVP